MAVTQKDLSETQRALLAERLQRARQRKTPPGAIEVRPPGERPVLSFAQQRLWFLFQWEPDNPSYNIPMAIHLSGQLDVPALERTLNTIIQRHRVLSMIYRTDGEDAALAPHPRPSIRLSPTEIGVPTKRHEETVRQIVAQDTTRPFDLEHDLPIRATLLRLDKAEHVLILNIHHIAADGWSLTNILVKEMVALYAAYRAGQPSPLPDLAIQYSDFAYWQRQWLQGEVLQKQLDYWKKSLAGAPAILELPVARQRPPVLGFSGATHLFDIDPAVVQGVKTLAQQTQMTHFMVWLAAFKVLLWRYSGQTDIVVGTPIAGRNRSEIEDLIGLFVNTLVLRTDLAGDPTVDDLLWRVRETTLNAYANQDLPFEKLVEELHPERNLSHHPLFQVMFNYHNMPHKALELDGLRSTYMDVTPSASKFDLSLTLAENETGLYGQAVYNTDLFDAETIERMMAHYRTLTFALVARAERRISTLPLLESAQRATLVAHWTDTAAEYPETACMHQLFEEQVERTPNATAVVFEDQAYTYRQLNAHANQIARHLKTLGVGPEARVGLYVQKSLNILAALLGILKAGGAYVPLDPLYPPERVRLMMQDAGVDTLITQSSLAKELPRLDGVQTVCIDADWQAITTRYSTENPPIQVTPANLFYVLFTSGSTGRPKGVAVEHRNYLNYFRGVMPKLRVKEGMHYAMVSTFSTDLGTIQFWAPLTTGGTTHIVAYERATDPRAMVDYFRRHRIDVLKLVPSHYAALQGMPDSDDIVPRHLVIFTGEASHWETVAQVKRLNPACMVQDHYGVTETTCATLVKTVPDTISAHHTYHLNNPGGGGPIFPNFLRRYHHAATLPLGEPLGNVRVHTLDKHLEPAPPGVPGELCIGGLGVTRGYFGRPGLTAERFVPDPFSNVPGARMYRTGDLAYFRNDGSLKLLGRMDFQIKIRGYRIEAGEIETLLCEQPSVQDAVVMSREDTLGDSRLAAYVVPHPQHADSLAIAPLRDALRENLPDYMVPTAFVVMDDIPLNPNGKVDRFKLPAPEYTRLESGTPLTPPRNEIEEHIAGAWREVLGLEEIGIDDNFFDIGGESFKAIRTVRKIGAGISVMDLFKHPTVRELAELTAKAQPKTSGLLHELTKPIPAHKKKLSLVCVPYGGGNAIVYRPLAEALPDNIALYAIQLPGHDFSRQDDVLQSTHEVARRCVEEIKRDLNGPIALYGHCVGAALAIEITRLLEDEGIEVTGVYIAGAFPTSRIPGRLFEWLHRVFPTERWTSRRTIYEGLRALGGFPDDMGKEERAFALESLRHDAIEAEEYYTHAYSADPETLRAPILCIVGEGDRATELHQERFREWGFFSHDVDLAVIPQAGHYFLKYQAQELADIVGEQWAVWQGEKATASHAPVAAHKPQIAPSLRTFFIVALGQLVSLIGTGLTAFGLGVWVYQETGSFASFAAIQVTTFLPGILALPFSGTLADRCDRRKLMILSDTLAGLGTLLLALLLWMDALQLWHIYVFTTVASLANAFQRPAYMAAVAQLVPKQYLGHANGFVQLGTAAGDLVASFLGGALLVAIGLPGIVSVDVLTFLFAILPLLFIRYPDTLFRRREESFLKEITGGWHYIVKRPGFLAMVIFFTVFNYLFSLVQVGVTPMTLAFTTPEVLGVVLAFNGVGVLVGGLIMGLWGGTRRRAEGMVGFVVLYGASVVVMGLRPAPFFVGLGLFGIGVAITITNAHWLALIQAKVGLELQGRVLAMNQMLGWAMIPVGFVTADPLVRRVFDPLIYGPLASPVGQVIGTQDGHGLRLMMLAAGALFILLSIAGYKYRPLRFMEDRLPDAIPDTVIIADKDKLQALADQKLVH
jgi:amino acid adenylation domain-containing protein